jgi:multiple sugar transport system ATP-binding protein
MASIAFRQVSKVFGDGTCAVDALDLEIPDGEFTVLVGPSGSGKSTALRMVAGLEDATSGSIAIGEEIVNEVAPRDRDIAMVFQSYALYPHMSVADNLGFALRMRHVERPTVRSRVGDVAGRLSIDRLLGRRPRALSGGQRQRVALGRAIVRQPRAFLMDEPLSNLDAKLRVEMRAYIARLHQELGTTTLYVTHDQVEAMTMGDRVAVMRDGRLEQVAEPQTLYDRPANLFVAGFIGSPAMNLMRGRLGPDGLLELGSSRLRLPPLPSVVRHAGEEVVAGIRPEAIEWAPDGEGAVLELPVVLVESLGSDKLVHLGSDAPAVLVGDAARELGELEGRDARIVARLPPSTPARAGERLRVRVDVDRLHLFDPETEWALR